jgi:glycerol-3-phosphate dehydrogenase
VAGQPYLRAEAVYAVRHEMATTLDDVLVRRTRAHLFDRAAALAASLPLLPPSSATNSAGRQAETERQLDDYRRLCETEENAGVEHADVAHATD